MNEKKPAVVERKEVSLDVSVPLVGYNCIMPFNVFKIEPVENGKIMHFGYLQGSSVLNQFSCFISTEDITRNSKNVRSYFERLPQPQLVDMPTVLMKPKETVTIARYLNLSRVGTIAEIALIMFPLLATIVKNPDGKKLPITGIPVALLTSSLPIHQMFLMELFKETK